MAATSRPHPRRLRRGAKTEHYLAAISGEDDNGASTSSTSSNIPSSSDSPFEVQEYLSMLVAENPHDIQRLIQIPRWRRATSTSLLDKGKQSELNDGAAAVATSNTATASSQDNGGDRALEAAAAANEDHQDNTNSDDNDAEYDSVDRDVWLYEHLRRLAIDLSQPFVVTLQEHCSRETCPEMKAGEWLYLCAAHASANETECCAIDYITHTLDGATALLNSSRYFPSRINIPPTSLKHFTSIARRLYRIFAHAWYHHREIFDVCEASTSLYERFLALSLEYDLVPRELLTIPSQYSSTSVTNGDSGIEGAEDSQHARNGGNGMLRMHMNGSAGGGKRSEQDDKEEEEQHLIQRKILEKRILGNTNSHHHHHKNASPSSIGTYAEATGNAPAGSGSTAGASVTSSSGITTSGGTRNSSSDEDDEEEDDDSSEDSSDEESMNMPNMPQMSLAANAGAASATQANKTIGNSEKKETVETATSQESKGNKEEESAPSTTDNTSIAQ